MLSSRLLIGLRRCLGVTALLLGLGACSTLAPVAAPTEQGRASQLTQLLPADAILLGEQHDAPDHQRIHRWVVETLAARQALAALTLEMAAEGQSTEKLSPQASEDEVRAALQWRNGTWSWDTYGPIVMAAVRAGVPVLGANLPAARQSEAMGDALLDELLPESALLTQRQRIRIGHCSLLPESQVAPMTRIQISRDIAMARTLVRAAVAGKTVLLLAGSGHVDRAVGVPLHLPPSFHAKSILLLAEKSNDPEASTQDYDQLWPTPPAPPVDHCAEFSARRNKPATMTTPP